MSDGGGTKEVGLGLAVLGMFGAIVAWPWVGLGDRVFTQRDGVFTMVATAHLQDWLLGRADLGAAPIGWPIPAAVTQTDWTMAQAALGLPVRWLHASVPHQYAVVVFVGLLSTALACWAASRVLLGPGPHNWIAGAAGGFSVEQVVHAQHSNLVFHGPVIAAVGLVASGVWRHDPRRVALGVASMGLCLQFGVYMAVHAALLVTCALIVEGIVRGAMDRRAWAAVLVGGLVAASVAVPIAAAYHHAMWSEGVRPDLAEIESESVDLATLFAPLHQSFLEQALAKAPPQLDPANPGLVIALLALVGATALTLDPARHRGWATVGLASVVACALSFGPWIMWRGRPTWVPGPYLAVLHLPVSPC